MSAEEWERLKRRDRRVGLMTELPEDWVEAVGRTEAPEGLGHRPPDGTPLARGRARSFKT